MLEGLLGVGSNHERSVALQRANLEAKKTEARGLRFERKRDIRGGEGRGGSDVSQVPAFTAAVEAMLPLVTISAT